MKREQIVSLARSWLGTTWQHQACLKGVACDCIGLVVGVAKELGLPEALAWLSDAEFRGYSPLPNVDKLQRACAKYLERIPVNAMELGDIPLMTFAKEPMHFGIISQVYPRWLMVHAYATIGYVVENGIDAKWQRRIVGAYRYRGLDG